MKFTEVFYSKAPFNTFRPMSERPKNSKFDEAYPSEVRCPVFGNNQFQLPKILVSEVGFKSSRMDPIQSAKVGWYYHPDEDKAVLSNDGVVDRPSVEFRGTSGLSGISNDELETGDVSSARVTIIKDLPDSLHQRLTRGSVVLKPIYAGQYSILDSTCVSVYPSTEYDQGTLPNVDRIRIPPADDEKSDTVPNVGACDIHTNSV